MLAARILTVAALSVVLSKQIRFGVAIERELCQAHVALENR